jgi:CRISPR-associated exonuclease Cas4
MVVVEELYAIKQRDFSEKLRELTDPNIVYVTDLALCSHKRVMRIRYPLLSFQFDPQLILGDLVHVGIQQLLISNSSGKWKAEVSIEKEFNIDGRRIILKGRADLVEFSDEGRPVTVVEIKSARTLPSEAPLEHHVLQLRIYLQLLGAEQGVLLYVTPDRLVEYDVDPSPIDIEELVRETIYDLRVPRYEWECRYCPYRKICPFARRYDKS